ncbi:uncharacterized protein [Centruroides vittatus]|uniref:uncharacterized protein n=1 Tax=Centruroides vittatus TaxID=120091 RepID=UPI003510B8AA
MLLHLKNVSDLKKQLRVSHDNMKESIYLVILFTVCLAEGQTTEELEQLVAYCSIFHKNINENPNWNKCLLENSSLKQLGPNNSTAFNNNKCFCDEDCHQYGDCCPDILTSSNSSWRCRYFQFIPGMYIYMIQTCPLDWSDDDVRQLCENELFSLAKQGKFNHYLQDIPVYSLDNNIIYRNVFCAKCNRDTNLQKWNISFSCDKKIKNITLNNAVYQPADKKWRIERLNKTDIICKIDIPELRTWNQVKTIFNGRRCKGVSSCSGNWKKIDEIQKCSEFTEEGYYFSNEDNIHYKNPYCALCNYIDIKQLNCNGGTRLFSDAFGLKPWYPSLIDFNFDWNSENECNPQQLFDPISNICFNMSCDESHIRRGIQCVPNNTTNSLQKSCTTIVFSRDSFSILDNHTIFINYTNKNYSSSQYEPIIVNGELKEVLICADEIIGFNFSPVQYWMSEIGLLISIVCLLIHLIIYLLLPKLHNLPGKILICLSLSLLIAQLSFLLGAYDSHVSTWHCVLFAIVTHFSYLAAFFWMNVMAFDIYRTFCKAKSSSNHSRTFVLYSVYSWVSSTLIIFASLIMNFVFPENLYSPNYGRNVCWISEKRSLLVFFAFPLFVLLTVNIIFFFLTARSLLKTTRETKMVNKVSDKVRFILYIKIALMLGLTWIFGFIATLTNVSLLWYPFIIFNSLQGAFIFVSFTVKKKIFDSLKERIFGKSSKKKYRVGQLKQCTSSSNLSTIQTSLTTSLSASLPVLSNQAEVIKAIINNGKYQDTKGNI